MDKIMHVCQNILCGEGPCEQQLASWHASTVHWISGGRKAAQNACHFLKKEQSLQEMTMVIVKGGDRCK